MAIVKVDPPPISTSIVDPKTGMPTKIFVEFVHKLWKRTGGERDAVNISPRLNNLTATTEPTVNDDSVAGYEPLSSWVITATGEIWLCLRADTGAANWQLATLTTDDLGSAALSDNDDFDAAGTADTAVSEHAATRNHPLVTITEKGFLAAVDKVKLNNIENNATADQTDVEIKAAYESNSNTNAFTDAKVAKLANIEIGATADQTKADIDGLGIDADTLDGISSLGFDAAGDADTAVSNHVAETDPHTQYAEIAGQTFTGDIAAPKITASTGILFGTDTAAANTLDDYEQGTWTPVIGGGSCTNVVGKYTKVGNKVTVTLSVIAGVLTGATTSKITGLPFTNGNTRSTTSNPAFLNLYSNDNPVGVVIENNTKITFVYNVANGVWNIPAFINTSNAYLHFSATYFIN